MFPHNVGCALEAKGLRLSSGSSKCGQADTLIVNCKDISNGKWLTHSPSRITNYWARMGWIDFPRSMENFESGGTGEALIFLFGLRGDENPKGVNAKRSAEGNVNQADDAQD